MEGNTWNYSLYFPQDIKGLSEPFGEDEILIKWIDTIYTIQIAEEKYAHSEDLIKTGVIGNYVHGNESSHQIPYMYKYFGAVWKIQEKINLIVNTTYKTKADCLLGNDDCGEMFPGIFLVCLDFTLKRRVLISI